MIEDALPDIPRLYTAIAEWGACVVYILLAPRRPSVRRLVLVLAGGLVVIGGVQVLAGRLPLALWTFGMLLAVAAMLALIYLGTRGSWRLAGYLVARAFVLAELVASFHWQLEVYFFHGSDEGSAVLKVLLWVVMYAGLLVVAYLLERRHFPADVVLEVDMRAVLSSAAVAATTFLVSNLSFLTTRGPFSGRAGSEIFYIRTLSDLAGFVALFAMQGQRVEVSRVRQVEAMDRLMRSQHDQYLASQRSMDGVNRKYHDLKHYLQAIRAEENPAARGEYLDHLERSIQPYETQVQTGNRVLDVVLSSHLAECADLGIVMTCVADGALLEPLGAMDLSVLIGNALDNAIEATQKVPEPDRRLIRVAVYAQGGVVMIRVDNYVGDLELDLHDGLPRTTKDDPASHGYGLTTMRQVAERLGGSLTVRVEDGWFTVRVLLALEATPGGAA